MVIGNCLGAEGGVSLIPMLIGLEKMAKGGV